jgi:hypothetical protein
VAFTFGSLNSSELTFVKLLDRKLSQDGLLLRRGDGVQSGEYIAVGGHVDRGLAIATRFLRGRRDVTRSEPAVNPRATQLVLGGVVLVAAAIMVTVFAATTHLDLLAEQAKKAAPQSTRPGRRSDQAPEPQGRGWA